MRVPQHPTGRGYEEDLHGLVTRDGRPTELYEEAAAIGRTLVRLGSLLPQLEAETLLNDDHHYWATTDRVRTRVLQHRLTGERLLMLVNYDFERPHAAVLPPALHGVVTQLTDLRTGRVWSPGSLSGLVLDAGDRTVPQIPP